MEIVNGDEDEGDDIIDEDQPDEDAAMIVVTHVSTDGSHIGIAPKTQSVTLPHVIVERFHAH